MKNKRLAWILVMILIALTLVPLVSAAFTIPQGVKNFLDLKVVVNTVILAGVFYLVLSLIGGKHFDTKTGPGRMLFILVVMTLSIYFAMQVIGDKYVWQYETVLQAKDYLFGEHGIFKGTRLIVFVTFSLLISWLFTATLNIGKGNHKIDIALAVIIGLDAAHSGMTMDTVILLGQFIATFLFYRQFQTEGRSKWMAFTWAFTLVAIISSITFPKKGFFLFRWWGGIFTGLSFRGKLWFIILVVPVLVVLALAFSKVMDKEKKAKKEIQIAKDASSYIGSAIKDIGRLFVPFLNRVHIKDYSPEGEVPFIFKRLRVELNVLINYLLRLQVYEKKQIEVREGANIGEKINSSQGTTWSANRVKANAFQYKRGAVAVQNPDTTVWRFLTRNYERVMEDGKIVPYTTDRVGWVHNKYLIFMLMNIAKKKIENKEWDKDASDLIKEIWNIETTGREETTDNIIPEEGAEVEGTGGKPWNFKLLVGDISVEKEVLTSLNERKKSFMNREYDLYISNVKNYGKLMARDIEWYKRMDMTRKTGLYDHMYLFARPWARPWLVEGEIVNGKLRTKKNGGKIRLDRPIGYYEKGGKLWGLEFDKLWEIDYLGRVLEDVYEIDAESKTKTTIQGARGGVWFRQIQFNERINHPAKNWLLKYLDSEWRLFIRDFKWGEFHRDVRLVKEYLDAHQKPYDLKYKKLRNDTSQREDPKTGNPAFDRQALKDPGNFVYRGIKDIYNDDWTSLTTGVINNVPCASLRGLTMYVQSLLDLMEGNVELKKQHARTYGWFDGEKVVTEFGVEEKKEEGKK